MEGETQRSNSASQSAIGCFGKRTSQTLPAEKATTERAPARNRKRVRKRAQSDHPLWRRELRSSKVPGVSIIPISRSFCNFAHRYAGKASYKRWNGIFRLHSSKRFFHHNAIICSAAECLCLSAASESISGTRRYRPGPGPEPLCWSKEAFDSWDFERNSGILRKKVAEGQCAPRRSAPHLGLPGRGTHSIHS